MKGRPDVYLLGHAAAKRQTQLSKGGATKAAGPHQSPNLGLRAEGLHMYKYIYIHALTYYVYVWTSLRVFCVYFVLYLYSLIGVTGLGLNSFDFMPCPHHPPKQPVALKTQSTKTEFTMS